MINVDRTKILESMIEVLDLPPSAYEKAKNRYESLGDWFGRNESILKEYDPHVFSQGSFRLGTAIRPFHSEEEYDLDLACKLRTSITKGSHTQQEVKELVGSEVESYRKKNGIHDKAEAKKRCWRLSYKDDLSFHVDIVPCIPADETRRTTILESLRSSRMDESIAGQVSNLTVNITDNTLPNYKYISDDWNVSNPEGYALWFESRTKIMSQGVILEAAQVDELPLFKRKTTLQRVIQILKRHRDSMFDASPDLKPISVIITTLAARAYSGETDLATALYNVSFGMENHLNSQEPRVPNPVNPGEDFSDKWDEDSRLEVNFKMWLKKLKSDVENLVNSGNRQSVTRILSESFNTTISDKVFDSVDSIASQVAASPAIITKEGPKPWQRK